MSGEDTKSVDREVGSPEQADWQSARTSAFTAVVALLAALAALIWANSYPPVAARAPMVVAVVTACAAAVVAARAILRMWLAVRKGATSIKRLASFSDAFNVALLVTVETAVYVVLLVPLGFLLATALYTIGMAYTLGYRSARLRLVVFGVLVSLGLFVLFTEVFGIRLPESPLL